MKKELPPVVVWGVIAVIAIVVIGIGVRMFGSGKTDYQKTGSEQLMNKVKSGGALYTPPAGAPVPGAPGYNAPGQMPAGAPTGPPPGSR